jgi:hypothetical protein
VSRELVAGVAKKVFASVIQEMPSCNVVLPAKHAGVLWLTACSAVAQDVDAASS